MKRFTIISLTIMMAAFSVSARPTGFRLGGGYAMDYYNSAIDGTTLGLDNKFFYGAFVEMGYDCAFDKHNSLCIGARFTALTNSRIEKGSYYKSDTDYSIAGYVSGRMYVDIPVMYQFAFNVNPSVQLFFNVGPTLNFYLFNSSIDFSKTKTPKGETPKSVNENNWFKNNPYTAVTGNDFYNRVDLSLGAAFGVYFHHVKIYAGYDHSVIPFIKSNLTGNTMSTYGQIRVGAAYVF